MNFLFVIAATVSLIVAPLSFFLFLSMERYRKRAKQLEVQLATSLTQASSLQKEVGDIKELRQQNSQFLEQKSIAVTERQESEKKLEALRIERDVYLRQKEESTAARMEAEKKLELIQQRMQETEKRMQDWELQRAESLKAAKASILEAGGQLSNKLLEDHKRETEAAKKDAETNAKKASEALLEQMTKITESVAALKDKSGQTEERMDTVWKALTSPTGAGYLAEVGLENTLKNLGLEPARDYIIQYAINGSERSGKLRPDAIIFLPHDRVMVVDCKSSKFMIEIANSQDGISESEALAQLAKTMNEHLKALVNKDYKSEIIESYKEAGRGNKISAVFSIMYLPSEGAITQIKRADPEFTSKAQKAGIMIASPESLFSLFSVAQLNINMARQAENQDAIVENVRDLMDNTITVLTYADKMGRGLKSAADSFEQFARSANRRMLPKLRNLLSLGVTPKKNKEIPGRIVSYDIRPSDDMLTIEGEAEALEDQHVIEDFPQKKVSA